MTKQQQEQQHNGTNLAFSNSNRLRRARQLRQQRLKARGGTFVSQDEETLVVSGACTVLAALVIMATGAGLAILFFSIYQPDCVKDLTFYNYHNPPSIVKVSVEKTTSN
jgi:hypothetical protein